MSKETIETLSLMNKALEIARQAIGLSSPNPRVGCVIVVNGDVVGQGFTQAAGEAHAEVMAIRDAQLKNIELAGCTVYVTLEPCSHFGRTPPCVNALLGIKPARVVVAMLDPNPLVAGNGVKALQAAGVDVDVLPTESEPAMSAYELNLGFVTRMKMQRVYTRLKWASSADGKTALPDGRSQWITGEAARHDGHGFRARADVIVTGIGTVLSDNPALNVRGFEVKHQPIKCVIDAFARTPSDSKLFADDARVWLVCANLNGNDVEFLSQKSRIDSLSKRHPNLKVIHLSAQEGRICLPELWSLFYEAQINEVHVEAGGMLNASLLSAGLIDEILMYLAPRVVGAGKSVALFDETISLDELIEAGQWHWQHPVMLEHDVRLVLQKNDA